MVTSYLDPGFERCHIYHRESNKMTLYIELDDLFDQLNEAP